MRGNHVVYCLELICDTSLVIFLDTSRMIGSTSFVRCPPPYLVMIGRWPLLQSLLSFCVLRPTAEDTATSVVYAEQTWTT